MKYVEYIGQIAATDSLKERISRINQSLREKQVLLRLEQDGEGKDILTIEYEKRQKNERNAGRHRLDVSGGDSSLWRVSDVKASMKEIGYQETAKLLGCSKSTLYRRLKELEGKDDWLFY